MPKLSKLSVLSLLAPFAAAAQIAPVTNTPVPLSKALVFPNYDNVLVGKEQAIEGGAYIARVSDPSANFNNPAGLVQAEKVAQANLIKRREDTAATRSLLNTARLMDENPTLLRLKELETLEKVTEKIDKLTVFGGLEGVLKDVVRIQVPSA